MLGDPMPANVALGHRRLSILDISEHGLQPMRLPGADIWITFNGEIYNYLELRAELETQGHRFQTGTDTEVILKAYKEWGTECFSRFNGMWALAILDLKQRTVTLSRDRFGIKPLHLLRTGDMLAFSSEIKALLATGHKPRLNASAAKSFLQQHLVSHTQDTFFQGIEVFPPAHFANISLDSPTRVIPVRYWDYPTGTIDPSDAMAKAEFHDLLASSMQLHMRSDVPVGSCLSGGLDSSAIVCMADAMLEASQRPFHTFTALFNDKTIDETPWVDAVNTQTQAMAHHVSPNASDLLADMDALVWHQDEPFTSASIYAQWCVMREARRANIPVLLDGQGADEILCGYKKFYVHHLKLLWSQAQLGEAAKETLGFLIHGDRTVFRLSDAQRYLPGFLRQDMQVMNKLTTDRFKITPAIAAPSLSTGDTLTKRQQNDLTYFSLPSLLRYEDRNSMAFSIESRVPFLDHQLVEYALQLAPHHKLRRGTSKHVMREAIEGVVPASVSARRDKMGFGAPQRQWLKDGIIRSFQSDIRQGNYTIGELVDAGQLARLLQHTARDVPPALSRLVFQLFTLNRWGQRFQVDFSA